MPATGRGVSNVANKVVTYTQVPIAQKDVREIHFVALNDAATTFQLTAVYNIWDLAGVSHGTGSFSQQVNTTPDATLLASILAAANAAQGT